MRSVHDMLTRRLLHLTFIAIVSAAGCGGGDVVDPSSSDDIAGTWAGTQTTGGVTYAAELVLTGPEGGSGTIHPPTGTCRATLTGSGHSGNVYNFGSSITSGPCIAADIRAVLNGNSITAEIRVAGTSVLVGSANFTRR